jgi:hypothetical protein
MKKLLIFAVLACAVADLVSAQTDNYYTGNAGRGIRIAVIAVQGSGIVASDRDLLSLIQSSLTADFRRFSAMTVLDRSAFDAVIAEQGLSETGDYSQSDYNKIGRLINARYIVAGSLSSIRGDYALSLAVVDTELGTRRASYGPVTVSAANIRNLSALKDASASLLPQLGVSLTDAGKTALRETDSRNANARAALARADALLADNPTSVEALAYYYQAAALDPALLDAANRASVVAQDISSGDPGKNARRDIEWRQSWVDKLTETENYFTDFFKTYNQPYALVYSTDFSYSIDSIDYRNETAPISFEYAMSEYTDWTSIVTNTVEAVRQGLNATGNREKWGLPNWPMESMAKRSPFQNGSITFTVRVELVNDEEKVIGSETVTLTAQWVCDTTTSELKMDTSVSPSTMQTLTFSSVAIADITDTLTIRFSTVNGMSVARAGELGVLMIATVDTYRDADGYNIAGYDKDGYNREGKTAEQMEQIAEKEAKKEAKRAAALRRRAKAAAFFNAAFFNDERRLFSVSGYGGSEFLPASPRRGPGGRPRPPNVVFAFGVNGTFGLLPHTFLDVGIDGSISPSVSPYMRFNVYITWNDVRDSNGTSILLLHLIGGGLVGTGIGTASPNGGYYFGAGVEFPSPDYVPSLSAAYGWIFQIEHFGVKIEYNLLVHSNTNILRHKLKLGLLYAF